MAATCSLVLATRNPHKVREIARLLEPDGIEVEPLPGAVELPPETGRHVRRQRAAQGAGRGRRDRAPGDRRRLGDRGRGARRRARGPLGALRRARRDRRGEPRQAAARGARRKPRCGTCARSPTSTREPADEQRLLRVLLGARGRAARAGRADSATTRRSSPTTARDGRTMAELSDGEKDAISHRGDAVRALAGVAARLTGDAAAGRPARASKLRTRARCRSPRTRR